MVTVLLATYMGEKYIAEQLESLITQTVKEIRIVVRDDGSTDRTLDIVGDFKNMYPDMIEICTPEQTGLGAAGNFFKMLQIYSDDYIMFCDQDDFWLPDKVEKTLSAMEKAEEKYGTNTPILVHTDLAVADEKLNVISPSFAKFQKLDPSRDKLRNLLMQNCVTGCTVMLNRSLQDMLFYLPEKCAMHDWWIALVASAVGKIVYLPESTILYRQHSSNQVGAKNAGSFAFLTAKLANTGKMREMYKIIFCQAATLKDNYSEYLTPKDRKLLSGVSQMRNMSKFKKIKTIKKFGLEKNTLLRTVGQYLLI